MADFVTNFFETLMNGKTAGIPNIAFVLGFILLGFLIYMYLTKTPKVKEFKALDMKKETKRRFKKDYKYFGMSLNQNMYDVNNEIKPIAYIIGFMKIVEMKHLKRLEPIYEKESKEKMAERYAKLSKEIYKKDFDALNAVEKKNVYEIAKEEVRNAKIEVMDANAKVKIKRGRKEVEYSEPVAMYCFRICKPDAFSKVIARVLGLGTDWTLFDANQVSFGSDRVTLNANFQRRSPNEIFVFSRAGMNLVQDISYEVERENIWQETANQIPRAVHFDTEASKQLVFRREDAKIEQDKKKAQREGRSF